MLDSFSGILAFLGELMIRGILVLARVFISIFLWNLDEIMRLFKQRRP